MFKTTGSKVILGLLIAVAVMVGIILFQMKSQGRLVSQLEPLPYEVALAKVDTLFDLKTQAANEKISLEEFEAESERLVSEIDSLREIALGYRDRINNEIQERQKKWERHVERKIYYMERKNNHE